MAGTTEVKVFKNKVFTNFIEGADIAYPFDISQLTSEISGCILQWDADESVSNSLTRNRVGAAMTLVGAPTVAGNAATFSAGNFINTGIDLANYNTTPLTMIAIVAENPGGQAPLLGSIQWAAPQRMRGLDSSASQFRAKTLNSSGAAQSPGFNRSMVAGTSEFLVGRFNPVAPMSTVMTNIRTGQTVTANHALPMYTLPAGKMAYIGGSEDGVASGASNVTVLPVKLRAALIFTRILTDDEVSLVYRYYKNYYSQLSTPVSI